MATPRGYYQQLFCTRICQGQPPRQIRVIHTADKKKFYEIKMEIILLRCEKLSC